MRKEEKMTGKGNLKRYYLPKVKQGLYFIIMDRDNGTHNQIFTSRDEARAALRVLNGTGATGERAGGGGLGTTEMGRD